MKLAIPDLISNFYFPALAAAEAVVGLAIVLAIYQNLRTIDVDAAETLSG